MKFKFIEENIFTKRGRIKRTISRANKAIAQCDKAIEIFSNLKPRTKEEIREEKKEARKVKRAEKRRDEVLEILNDTEERLNSCVEAIRDLNKDLDKNIESSEKILDNVCGEDNSTAKSDKKGTIIDFPKSNEAEEESNKEEDTNNHISEEVNINDNTLPKKTVKISVDSPLNRKVTINKKQTNISIIKNRKYNTIIDLALMGSDYKNFLDNLALSNINYVPMENTKNVFDIREPNIYSVFTITEEDGVTRLDTVVIHPTLLILPHGNRESIYNTILRSLNIEKCSPYDHDKESSNVFVRLDDGNVACCNIILRNKDLSLTIVFLDKTTIEEFKAVDSEPDDEDEEE